ncbi:hypothetical protein SPRG_17448, partial [Saprolegnia parasitica CBS 223.65]
MSLYAPPTTAEMLQLNAADASSVYTTNFLRLQTTQLLDEVRIAYDKVGGVNPILVAVKQSLDALPEQQVTSSCLAMPGLPTRNLLKE